MCERINELALLDIWPSLVDLQTRLCDYAPMSALRQD